MSTAYKTETFKVTVNDSTTMQTLCGVQHQSETIHHKIAWFFAGIRGWKNLKIITEGCSQLVFSISDRGAKFID